MEPRHRDPEFHSEFELDYTDNAIYLTVKRERVKLAHVGPQVPTARMSSLQTIQPCADCVLPSNLFRSSLGERQTLGLLRGFWEALEEAENLFLSVCQSAFSRW